MNNIFYTYVHRKPNGEIFYVGKGKDKRAWSHNSRNRFWKGVVAKYGYTVEIIDDNLSEQQAFELEEFLISYCKTRKQGGTLVNFTDGGKGTKGVTVSPESRAKRSLSSKGSANKNSDKNLYTFVNYYTDERYTGTRQDFTTQYSVDVSHLFKNSNVLTIKSWCLLENLDKVVTPKHDCRVHTFVSIDGEVVTATRADFKIKTGVDPNPLFGTEKSRCDSTQGWCLEGNSEKIKLHASHNQVYTFENVSGLTITTTREDFKLQTGVNAETLFGKKKRNSCCGWRLKGNLGKIVITMPRDKVHIFVHSDGTVIKATRSEFKKQTGMCTKNLFKKNRVCKSIHGWSLAPDQD